MAEQNHAAQLTDGHSLATLLTDHFHWHPARSQEDELDCYAIRHQVYCEELRYVPCRTDLIERDRYDRYSKAFLITRKLNGEPAGTIRLICPPGEEPLALEQIEGLIPADAKWHPKMFDRHTISEVSRLAIPVQFRRRQQLLEFCRAERRCLSQLGIALYFAGAHLALQNDRPHVFVVMEPRLARSLSRVGILFQQLGPAVDYHGERAAFYIDARTVAANVSPIYLPLFEALGESLEPAINALPKQAIG